MTTTFCRVEANILGVSVWNLLYVTIWHLETSVPLFSPVYLVHPSSLPTCILYPKRFVIKTLCAFLMSDKWYTTNPLIILAFVGKK